MKKIRVGLYGLGKTGKLVAGEFIKDDRFDLKWVVKRTKKRGESYASRLLGYETKTGAIRATRRRKASSPAACTASDEPFGMTKAHCQ